MRRTQDRIKELRKCHGRLCESVSVLCPSCSPSNFEHTMFEHSCTLVGPNLRSQFIARDAKLLTAPTCGTVLPLAQKLTWEAAVASHMCITYGCVRHVRLIDRGGDYGACNLKKCRSRRQTAEVTAVAVAVATAAAVAAAVVMAGPCRILLKLPEHITADV